MSVDDVSFGYSPLSEFMSRGFIIPKTISIIPVFRVGGEESVYGVLGLNKNMCVTGLGNDFKKSSVKINTTREENDKNNILGISHDLQGLDINDEKKRIRNVFVSRIADALRYDSLNIIDLPDQFVSENSFVAYAYKYDVAAGKQELDVNNYVPIIFVEIIIDRIEKLQNLIIRFRELFTYQLSGVIKTDSNIVALTYMDCTSMFYLFRYTTWKVISDDGKTVVTMSVEENGIPAFDFITDVYKCDKSKGEIPLTAVSNQLANRSPEIEFYDRIEISIGHAFTAYSNANLSFM